MFRNVPFLWRTLKISSDLDLWCQLITLVWWILRWIVYSGERSTIVVSISLLGLTLKGARYREVIPCLTWQPLKPWFLWLTEGSLAESMKLLIHTNRIYLVASTWHAVIWHSLCWYASLRFVFFVRAGALHQEPMIAYCLGDLVNSALQSPYHTPTSKQQDFCRWDPLLQGRVDSVLGPTKYHSGEISHTKPHLCLPWTRPCCSECEIYRALVQHKC